MNTSKKSLSDERLYTPDQLESIVEKRLSRERKKNMSLFEMRDVISALRQEEAFKELSNKELAKKLSELSGERETASKDDTDAAKKDTPEIPDTAEKEVKSGDPEKENSEKTEENKDPEKEKREKEISEFISLYGEEKLNELMSDRTFKSFCRRRQGDLVTLYEDYFIFMEGIKNTRGERKDRAAQRGLASTGFSGYAAGTPDYASLLTENQKRIATSAGMSYKQYATLLSQIPTKKLGK